jgi:hypothetical protein
MGCKPKPTRTGKNSPFTRGERGQNGATKRKGFTPTLLCPTIPGMARRETSLTCTLLCIIGMRHTLMLPGIDADMREFGEMGIRKHERELQAANPDEIDTLLTVLKLRDDWQGREMAWWLQWILLKAETRARRRSLFTY